MKNHRWFFTEGSQYKRSVDNVGLQGIIEFYYGVVTDRWLPVTHSQLVPAALAATIAEAYRTSESVQVTLLRSWTNDVYALSADAGHFVLKVYRKAWRGSDNVRWEVELQDWLNKRHAPVPSVVPLANGCLFGSLLAPEGARCFALFHRASGDKPSPPWSPALYMEYGRACALLHEAATDFTSTTPRFQRALADLLDEPVLKIEAWLDSRPEDVQNAFLRGYRSVRPFFADEVAAVPYFVAADALRMTADEVGRWAQWFGTQRVEAWVAEKLVWLRQWESEHAV